MQKRGGGAHQSERRKEKEGEKRSLRRTKGVDVRKWKGFGGPSLPFRDFLVFVFKHNSKHGCGPMRRGFPTVLCSLAPSVAPICFICLEHTKDGKDTAGTCPGESTKCPKMAFL